MAVIDDINEKLTAVADAIRSKTGGTALLSMDQMATEVDNLVVPDMSQVTATASTVYKGKTFYDAEGELTTGTMEGSTDFSVVTADESTVLDGAIFFNSDGDLDTGTMANRGAVTATLDQSESYTIPVGYHNGSGKVTAKKATKLYIGTFISGRTCTVKGDCFSGSGTSRSISSSFTTNLKAIALHRYSTSSISYPNIVGLYYNAYNGTGCVLYETSSGVTAASTLSAAGITATYSSNVVSLTFPSTTWISGATYQWVSIDEG